MSSRDVMKCNGISLSQRECFAQDASKISNERRKDESVK